MHTGVQVQSRPGTVGTQRGSKRILPQGLGGSKSPCEGEQSEAEPETDGESDCIVMQTPPGAGLRDRRLTARVSLGPDRDRPSSPCREVQGLALGCGEPVGNLGLQPRNQRRWKHLLSTYWLPGTGPNLYLIFKTIFRGRCYYPNFTDS